MIGARDWSRGWFQASGASVALHVAAVVLLIWRPDVSGSAAPVAPLGELRMDVTAITPTVSIDPAQTLTSVVAPGLPAEGTGAAIASVQPTIESDTSEILTSVVSDPGLTISGTLTAPAAPRPGAAETPGGAVEEAQSDAPPADPRIAELFARIRDRLTEPCLLALPALLGDDQIQLGVLAADDRQISALMRDLTTGLDTEIEEHAVLLDRRQCAGLTFARHDPGYPVPGLSLQLEAQDIASGQNVRGRISGGAGLYTTLLLVDDNGVVHDMRRFLVGSTSGSRFDIPVARDGQSRDTHQLILAIASPDRPDAVSRHAGQTADDFFAALAREIGQRPRIGVASVYVR